MRLKPVRRQVSSGKFQAHLYAHSQICLVFLFTRYVD
jgi:hypothetical protein